jgi:hypothetical protein
MCTFLTFLSACQPASFPLSGPSCDLGEALHGAEAAQAWRTEDGGGSLDSALVSPWLWDKESHVGGDLTLWASAGQKANCSAAWKQEAGDDTLMVGPSLETPCYSLIVAQHGRQVGAAGPG